MMKRLNALWNSIAFPENDRSPLFHQFLWLALFPASLLYSFLISLRTALYDVHVLEQKSLPHPVISIGNITVGGTGKTPFTEKLAQLLHGLQAEPAILSRGYGTTKNNTTDDDESLPENIRAFTNRYVHPDRYRAGQTALNSSPPDIFLLDDGFQHRALRRELDIVLVSAIQEFGNNTLLPAGPLREPPSSLRRADCLILTHAGSVTNQRLLKQKEQLRTRISPATRILTARHRLKKLVRYGSNSFSPLSAEKLAQFQSKTGIGFSGIGSPKSFRSTIEEANLDLNDYFRFPDHHQYSRNDLKRIIQKAKDTNASYLVTTRKDMKRCSFQPEIPVIVPEITFEILDGKSYFMDRIRELLNEFSRRDAPQSEGSFASSESFK